MCLYVCMGVYVDGCVGVCGGCGGVNARVRIVFSLSYNHSLLCSGRGPACRLKSAGTEQTKTTTTTTKSVHT